LPSVQLLFALRGARYSDVRSSSTAFDLLSIQPKQSASSTAAS